MRYELLDYRTSDGSMYISFSFCNLGLIKGWRIYILEDIDYEGHDTSSHATHRLQDSGETSHYICWDRRISSFEKAKTIAALWGDCTSRYIKGEGSFDAIATQIHKERQGK